LPCADLPCETHGLKRLSAPVAGAASLGNRETGDRPRFATFFAYTLVNTQATGGVALSTRIGLISDVHATPEPVAEALERFRQQNVDRVFCLGDIAGYGEHLERTVALLVENDCQAIAGNHELWHLEKHADKEDTPASLWFRSLPRFIQLTIEGKRLYMVHASPPDSTTDGIRLLDPDGNLIAEEKAHWTERLQAFPHDVLLVGHTHQVFCEQLDNTLVINPGSTRFNHSCAVLSFPEMKLEIFALSGQQPVKFWNWGINQVRGAD
jgi:putative phosphoesterase